MTEPTTHVVESTVDTVSPGVIDPSRPPAVPRSALPWNSGRILVREYGCRGPARTDGNERAA